MKKNSEFLVAMPSLQDSIFTKSVILLKENNNDGDFGVIINNKTDIQFKKLLLLLQIDLNYKKNIPVLIGGPINLDFIWVLHNNYYKTEHSSYLSSDIYLSSLADFSKSFLQVKNTEAKVYHIGIGYSSWVDNQLFGEIEEGSWWKCEITADKIFNCPLKSRWQTSLETIGVNPQKLYDKDNNNYVN